MSTLRSMLLLGALSLSAALSVSSVALACKCMFPTVEHAKEQAASIFEGRVTAIEDVPAPVEGGMADKRVTLQIVRTWKGLENEETVSVRTNASSASCGYTFEKNTSYLVYASSGEKGLEVSGCSRTKPMGDAGEDLAVLGAGITPVKVEPAAAPKPQAQPQVVKSGGCASTTGQASASLWFLGAPLVGMIARRRSR